MRVQRSLSVLCLAALLATPLAASANTAAPSSSPAPAGYSASSLLALGQAQRQAGELGAAIASFERATLLAPRDAELTQALRDARAEVGAEAMPAPKVVQIARMLSLREWSALVLGSSVAIAVLAMICAALRTRRRVLAGLLGVAMATGVLSLGGYALARGQLAHAIVLDPGAALRRSPFAAAEPLRQLAPGAEVELQQEEHAGFVYVTSSRGEQGWLSVQALAKLAAPPRS